MLYYKPYKNHINKKLQVLKSINVLSASSNAKILLYKSGIVRISFSVFRRFGPVQTWQHLLLCNNVLKMLRCTFCSSYPVCETAPFSAMSQSLCSFLVTLYLIVKAPQIKLLLLWAAPIYSNCKWQRGWDNTQWVWQVSRPIRKATSQRRYLDSLQSDGHGAGRLCQTSSF